MEKKLLAIFALLMSGICFAQVGINNQQPKATLDVSAKTTDGSKPEGIIAPRLTGNQIKAADSQYTTAQKGAIVYATAAVSGSTTKTANITTEGYYYFDGAVWQNFNKGNIRAPDVNIYKDNGTLTSDRTLNTNGNNLRFESTGPILTQSELSIGHPSNGGRVSLNPGGANNAGIMNIYNPSNVRVGYIGWDNTNMNYYVENGNKHIFNGGNVGVGVAFPGTKLAVRGDGTNAPLKLENLINQPATGNYYGLSVDDTGKVYKSSQSAVPFYYQQFVISNVDKDRISNFNTLIPSNKYTVAVVGFSFSNWLSIPNTTAPSWNFSGPQNIFAYTSGGTWRLTADYLFSGTANNVNGTWIINTLVMDKSLINLNPDVTVNLNGLNHGAAPASPVP